MAKKKNKRSLLARMRRLEVRELHKHPFAIPAAALLVLFFVSLGLFINFNGKTLQANDAHVVIINDKDKRQTLPTRAATVGEFLSRIDVKLNEGDVVEPTVDTQIVDDNFRVNVYRARPVTLVDGGHKTQSFSAATTPRSIAQQSGITVFPEDGITSQPTTSFLKDGSIGEQIVIDRATPTQLNLYGTPVALRTHAKTVADLLKEKQIKLASGDTLTPAASALVTPGMQIFVNRNGTQIVTADEPIPMETQVVEDATLSFGATAIRQAGSPGKKVITYQVDLQNGKEVARHVIQEVRAVEPVTQIQARGKAFDISNDKEAIMIAAGISPSDFPYVNYIVSHEGGWNGTTKYNGGGSGAYGLCQALPGSKMASAGGDWLTNPVTQLRWCSGYANARYGGWGGAYNHWLSARNW